jgi:hypothetical protein
VDEALDLMILDSGQPDRALAVARRACDLAVATLPCGDDLSALIRFRSRIDRSLRGFEKRPEKDELTEFGRGLFRFCIREGLQRVYDRLPASHVRLHIHSTRADLQALPWEYFQEPGQVPGPKRDRSIVRVVPTVGFEPATPRPLKAKVRVLFVSADPVDQEPVSWPEIKATIERTFVARIPERLELVAVEGATAEALTDAVAQQACEVFHFSGHGMVDNGRGHLVLVDRRTARSSFLTADDLAVILGGRGVQLAVLSACETAAGDFVPESFAVIAETLVRAGIPAVVANQLPVPDSTVASFVGAVYEKLLESGDIDLAVGEGRVRLAIHLKSARGATLEWGIPTLYRRLLSSQLFKP